MDMRLTHRRLTCVVSAFCLVLTAGTASAQQEYPTKPIRMLVGVAPGGATEMLARAIGTKMGENLHQQVIIDNRPGANHILAGQLTAKAPPDGYTIQVIPEGFQEGGVPGYEVSGWYGVIGPAAMPKTLVARINREINAILQVPETREQLSMQGAEPRTGTPEEFAAAMANDLKKWAKVVAAAGIKPQ